jgi:4-carboxymuconolactone decarboxylase
MSRIPLPSPEELSPEQRKVYDAIVSGRRGKLVGPLRAALHNPELADKWQQLGELLRYRTSLPARLSELAILVTGRHFDCQLEWQQHVPIALQEGVTEPVVGAIRIGQTPAFEKDDEAAIYNYSRELHERHFVSESVYQRALEIVGNTGLVELTALLGYYAMVAMTLNAHEIPLPDGGAPQLPPRVRP